MVNIKFLGVGNAFSSLEYGQSNIVIEFCGPVSKKLFLIDCGSDIRHLLYEQYPEINNSNIGNHIENVYISHLHGDHCHGLEWLGFCTYFNPECAKPNIFVPVKFKNVLWDHVLKGTMEEIIGKKTTINDFFNVNYTKKSFYISLSGKNVLFFELVESIHVNPYKKSYGLFITNYNNGKKVYITTDVEISNYSRNKWAYDKATLILHDCETTPYKSNVHPHYDDLIKLPDNIKKKMWLYHYSPDFYKYNPVHDGFAGFCTKGCSFEIT